MLKRVYITLLFLAGLGGVLYAQSSGAGGGVQYRHNTTIAAPIVNAIGFSDGGVIKVASVADPLPVAFSGEITIDTIELAGVSTEAKQDTMITSLATLAGMFGTAGSADSQVVTVQGVTSMTPLLVTLSGTNALPTGASTAAHQVTQNGYLDGLEGLLADVITAVEGISAGGGDATAANQTTIIGHIDGVETLLGTILTSTNFAAAFGTAGTPDTQVMSVQGITSMTPLLVTATGTVTANAGTNLNTSALLTTTAHDAAFGTAGTADTQVRTVQGIASMTPLLVTLSGTNNLTNISGTISLPTGAATEATLSTASGNIASILTSVQLLDNAVSGSGFQITSASVVASVIDLANSNPIAMIPVDADGNLIALSQDAEFGEAAVLFGPQLGNKFLADLTGTALVTTGDAVAVLADGMGRQLRGAMCPPGNVIHGTFAITDGSSTAVTSMGAQGANKVIEVTDLDLTNTSASNVSLDFRSGTGGSVVHTVFLNAGGMVSRPLLTPFYTAANTALAADPSASASTISGSLRGCVIRG